MRKTITLSCLAATVAGLAALCAAPAQAVPQNFAQFTEGVGAPPKPFTFTNSGASSTFSLVGSIPVNFVYQTPNGYGTAPGQTIAATLTFTSQVSAPAATGFGFIGQPMQNILLTFTANAPVSGFSNLLTVSMTTGTLAGQNGGSTASLSGTQSSTSFDQVNYASDFLDFSIPFSNKNFNLSFDSVVPIFTLNANGYVDSFNASGTGTFGSDPVPPSRPPGGVVPEPGTLVLAGMGAFSGLGMLRRRSRRG